MSVEAHANAILGLLRTGLPAEVDVYPGPDGQVAGERRIPADAQPPYVSVWFHRDFGEPSGLDHATTRVALRAICHCVGATDLAAQRVADLVAGVLLDVTPTIPGRACYPIRHEGSMPPREDTDTGIAVIDAVETYRLASEPE